MHPRVVQAEPRRLIGQRRTSASRFEIGERSLDATEPISDSAREPLVETIIVEKALRTVACRASHIAV